MLGQVHLTHATSAASLTDLYDKSAPENVVRLWNTDTRLGKRLHRRPSGHSNNRRTPLGRAQMNSSAPQSFPEPASSIAVRSGPAAQVRQRRCRGTRTATGCPPPPDPP